MTYYSNDPRRASRRPHDSMDSTTKWVVAALAALAILGLTFYAASNIGDQTASTTSTETIGSGAAPRSDFVRPPRPAPAAPAQNR
jgi:hypothetical protein